MYYVEVTQFSIFYIKSIVFLLLMVYWLIINHIYVACFSTLRCDLGWLWSWWCWSLVFLVG